jgi:hypothetical protein
MPFLAGDVNEEDVGEGQVKELDDGYGAMAA